MVFVDMVKSNRTTQIRIKLVTGFNPQVQSTNWQDKCSCGHWGELPAQW